MLSVHERLSEEELTDLERRTEGWVAGLQMILLSGGKYGAYTRGKHLASDPFRQPKSEQLESDIAIYLTEEVLSRQSPDVQQFLLKTAVLNRMSGSLCQFVMQSEESEQLLEYVVQAGLFVIPLDRDGIWYRYHHMFSRLLLNHLNRQYQEIVPNLHSRASIWYKRHGYTVEAIEHAIAAADIESASDLILQEAPELLRNEMHMLLRWFGQFPEDRIIRTPPLAVLYAWTLATYERLDEAEVLLDRSEPYLDSDQSLNGEDIRGYFSAMRCMICLGRNETEKAVLYNQDIMKRLGGVGNISSAYIVITITGNRC